jgi:hypothetical protein
MKTQRHRRRAINEGAGATGIDESGVAERTQVRAGVLDRSRALLGELLDRLLPLAEEVEDLDPLGAPERMTDPGELPVEGVLELPMGHLALA